MSDFYRDLKKFGGRRAIKRERHRDRVREYVLRQRQLGAIGCLFVGYHALSGILGIPLQTFWTCLAVLLFSTAANECRRMRACGRYWQTRRSLELIGI